jgi:RND family efflux transporter MFP subunit
MSGQKSELDDLRIDRSARPAPSLPIGWILSIIVLAGVVGFLVWWLQRPGEIEVRTAAAREVSGGSSEARTVLNASGYVTARREATISSKVTGKVVEVLVEEGKRVEAGQILARVDDTNIKASIQLSQAQLRASQSSLDETRVRLKEAELQFKRTADLARGGIATQADLDRAEADASSLRARLARQQADIVVAERELAVWQQQLDDTVIRAPFAGVVTSKNAQPGEMISPMSAGGGFTRTGICTIVDMTSLEIEVDVNEGYINRVLPAQPVEAKLDAYPDSNIPCHVIAVIPTADRQKATVKVRVGFDKLEARILPQMAAKVAFRGADAKAPAGRGIGVPREAVQTVDGREIIFIVQNGRIERRAVTTAGTRDDQTIVSAGVSAGERVVLNPPANIADGTKVKETKS